MLQKLDNQKLGDEGYVYISYGHPKYLKHVVASLISLRRYDDQRPVALLCSKKHEDILNSEQLTHLFDVIKILPEDHASIVGFKHNLHHYMLFEKNLYLDSDIIWCKNPDDMWQSLSIYDFTITGKLVSDSFFGAAKNAGIVKDVLLQRRRRTLKRFGLTYLSRVQSGIMFAKDYTLTKKVCTLAAEMLARKAETHFRSRKMEQGRTEESCEWSLAMAMSKLDVPVYPWLNGHMSIQLDYIKDLTEHDPDFQYVNCKYYCCNFINDLRGLKSIWLRKLLTAFFSFWPGKSDYLMTTPYCLHFGWYHQKQPFYSFAESVWKSLTMRRKERIMAEEKHSSQQ